MRPENKPGLKPAAKIKKGVHAIRVHLLGNSTLRQPKNWDQEFRKLLFYPCLPAGVEL